MKIVLISNLYPSSAEIKDQTGVMLLHQYAKCWSLGNEVEVINPHSYNLLELRKKRQEKLLPKFELDGIVVLNKSILRLPGDKLQVKKFAKIVNDLGSFDMIIGCLPVGLEIANYVGKKLNIPYFAYLHNTDFHRSGAVRGKIAKKYRRFLTEATGSMFVSPKLKIEFQSQLPSLDDFILPGAISKFWMENQPNRTFKSGGLKCITSGKLVRQKNIDSILYALAEIKKVEFKLDIAGDGDFRDVLERIAFKELNLSDKITFKGMVDHPQLRNLFDQNDFMLLLSTNESFGLVYLEAMARGCIPIGTIGEGIDGIIVHGHNGFLCSPDSQSIWKILLEISNFSSEKLMKISLNAMETASKYSSKDLAQSFIEFAKSKLN